MPSIRERLGLLRSIAAYYWKPFNKRRLMRFYAPFVKKGTLCFDIGAHLGNRTHAWEALGAKVIAVEPQPLCINYMKKKFKGNPNIIIETTAIGQKRGIANMHISAATPTVSTLANAEWRQTINDDTSFEVKWEKTLAVNMITLDDLIERYGMPAFCKIDVENYELEVLQGLTQPIPALSLEFYPATIENAIHCVERLEVIGNYEYNWSTAESQKFNSETWFDAHKMIAIFKTYTRSDKYGDFYARLV
jgi:FkbM family methyltransferase